MILTYLFNVQNKNYIPETLRASEKCSTFVVFDICEIALIELKLLFECRKFEMLYLCNDENYRENVSHLPFKHLPSNGVISKLHSMCSWRFSNIFVSEVQMNTKLLLQICLHLYGTRRRVAIVTVLIASLHQIFRAIELFDVVAE